MGSGSTVVLLLALCHAAAASRQLLVRVTPDNPPVTVPYNLPPSDSEYSTLGWIPDLTMSELAPADLGVDPEQVHVTHWGPGSLLFSWITGGKCSKLSLGAQVGPKVSLPQLTAVGSWVMYGPASGQYNDAVNGTANSTAYTQTYTNTSLGEVSYASGTIHHVLVTGLEPGQTIYYVVGDPTFHAWSPEFNVTVPPMPTLDNLPIKIAIIADLGQTVHSDATLQHLMANNPQLVWLIGDLTYADQYITNGTYQPRWDTWGRLIEQSGAYVPWNMIAGNHEIEAILAQSGSVFTSYNARFPNPQNPSVINTTAAHATFSPLPANYTPGANTDVNGYYSQNIAGAHIIWLNAHIAYWEGSAQYEWFTNDIASVDRTTYPWLIINIHVPFYHTYLDQYKVNEFFRELYEPIFYAHQVDLIISGHVHAYERTKPMFNYTVDECGPVQLVVGDGGNIEGAVSKFITDQPQPAYCADPSLFAYMWFIPTPTETPTLTLQNGQFCPTSQPDWSAYREPSFGHGILTIMNATHASWEWHRNQDAVDVVKDSATIIRDRDSQCASSR
ncbi:hypothetical protein N2152v2_008408 [Parachlorella kessleri]